jgi:hypothetical protein
MKTLGLGKRLMLILAGGITVLAMTGAAFVAGPALPAFADEGTPTPQAAAGPKDRGAALERIYAREQEWLKKQAGVLSKVDQIAGKVQTMIDNLKSKGVDVTKLQAALNAFESQVAKAQGFHDQAAGILGAHAGFGPKGEVIDRALALQTVKDAGSALRQCHKTLFDAGKDLRAVIREWRQNHPRPQNTVPNSATPSGAAG